MIELGSLLKNKRTKKTIMHLRVLVEDQLHLGTSPGPIVQFGLHNSSFTGVETCLNLGTDTAQEESHTCDIFRDTQRDM